MLCIYLLICYRYQLHYIKRQKSMKTVKK